ncbi:hypothetical protein EV421DRAFT_648340 [Armillaria borealis]|uniref:Uncharacterized protein n=1 Tax=Armillaria borealis TaxID=47425 RepID=A0AA39K1V7_9AGAR|nr:hypothetical protein EV421DRAFT_648340 [Armillaria borealis]
MHPSASAESSHRPPRPPSSASRRQLSSRPTSSLSTRPPTVVPRPASSASVRPHSRLTQRPQSRLARANHQRLTELCENLVRGVIGDVDREQVAYAARSLSAKGMTLNKAGIVLGETEVDRMIRGHVQKARIQSRDALADALQVSRRLLKMQVEKGHDLDQEIKVRRPSLCW